MVKFSSQTTLVKDGVATTTAVFSEPGTYMVNVLADDQRELADHFAGRPGDRAPEAHFTVIHDTPLVDGALAGRFLGDAKLYPAVSPKKTWAGAWGGERASGKRG